jgi:glycerol kinase
MNQYILALDQGTTSSRAILFDHAGQIRGVAQQEFRQISPQPGWVEHDANEIWHSQLAVAQQVLKASRVTATDIAAIGITNQRETTVLWDRKTGEPLANAIVWQDHRTADVCDALREQGKAALFQEKTGLVIDAYFLGHQAQMAARQYPRRARQSRRWGAGLRHHRCLVDLQALRLACHRHQQCVAHLAVQHPYAQVG